MHEHRDLYTWPGRCALAIQCSQIQVAEEGESGVNLVHMPGRKRRSEPDPLAPIDQPTWLVAWGPFRDVLESTWLPPETDLRGVLETARRARMSEGWDAQVIGSRCSFFFCTREGIRIMVAIERRDPALPPAMR